MYNWKLPPVNLSINGCIIFKWNSDVLCFFLKWKHDEFNMTLKMYFFQSQIRRVVNLLNQNLTRIEILNSKSGF